MLLLCTTNRETGYYKQGNRVGSSLMSFVVQGFLDMPPMVMDCLGDVPNDRGLSLPNWDNGTLPKSIFLTEYF